jgi:hypothetical protein
MRRATDLGPIQPLGHLARERLAQAPQRAAHRLLRRVPDADIPRVFGEVCGHARPGKGDGDAPRCADTIASTTVPGSRPPSPMKNTSPDRYR